ncbi:hypothetical protein BJ742DRAFT_781951 [Cladochytrium replicatum]|nr:hypothetical protein BJ742DRAFT_814501 [Cladochytrium replicatum]KAI8815012.1 hypothetical protein BJ742DRAFT_781951 [Cladochytrium replicatum]
MLLRSFVIVVRIVLCSGSSEVLSLVSLAVFGGRSGEIVLLISGNVALLFLLIVPCRSSEIALLVFGGVVSRSLLNHANVDRVAGIVTALKRRKGRVGNGERTGEKSAGEEGEEEVQGGSHG